MLEDVDAGLLTLFGSENRALTLAILANASGPLTGYRVAKTFGGQKIKVNKELRKLAAAGIVKGCLTEDGRAGWTVDDPDLCALLRRRIRICFATDWDKAREGWSRDSNRRLARIESALPDPSRNPDYYRPEGWKPSKEVLATLREKVRSPEKDAILRKYGARTSPREGLTL